MLDGVFASDPMAHISRGYSETLRALIGAVEARDAYTHGHSARVAELSVSVGLLLGLRPAALRALAEGAYLHDVGKVGIPDHVLNKPGTLTDEERAWIQEHPIVGTDIVGRAPSLREALKVIRQHHERYDGGGYPDGLAGDGSRWPPASWPWPTSRTRSPPTAPTGRRGRPTAPCATSMPAAAPTSTPGASTPSWP